MHSQAKSHPGYMTLPIIGIPVPLLAAYSAGIYDQEFTEGRHRGLTSANSQISSTVGILAHNVLNRLYYSICNKLHLCTSGFWIGLHVIIIIIITTTYIGWPDFSYAIPGRYPDIYPGHPPSPQHFSPPGYSSRTIPKDISHPYPFIINPVHKLNLCVEVKLGVLRVC